MNVIKISNISKTYNNPKSEQKLIKALDNISFDVESSNIFGLLGQNGAGKTTLIKVLLGIALPSSGSFSLLESKQNDRRILEKVGFLPENHNFPKFLSAKEFMYYFGKLSHLSNQVISERTSFLLNLVGLSERSTSKIRTFSKGMQQRLGLAQALINDPQLIFLDEPTDGVDPIGRKEIRDILIDLKSKGKTIFLNSHLLSEVEMITDRVAFLNNGKLVKEGSIAELTSKKLEFNLSLSTTDDIESLFPNFYIKHVKNNNYFTRFEDETGLNSLIDELRIHNISIREITPIKNSLEEIFIQLVKGNGGNNE